MPATRTCDFSGDDIEPGTGIVYVRTDGTILTFKDSKAEKNYFLGREGRNTEWTSIAHEGDEAVAADEVSEDQSEPSTGADETDSTSAEGGLGETLEEVEEPAESPVGDEPSDEDEAAEDADDGSAGEEAAADAEDDAAAESVEDDEE